VPDQRDRLTSALAGRNTIERELGAGGMATVYLAQDLKHHRKVAIKVLRPELSAILGAERGRSPASHSQGSGYLGGGGLTPSSVSA